MFDLIIMLSRYLFLFYIILFLWQAVVYVAYEQGGYLGSPSRAVSIQKGVIVWLHVTAFLILSYEPEMMLLDFKALSTGVAGLFFCWQQWCFWTNFIMKDARLFGQVCCFYWM